VWSHVIFEGAENAMPQLWKNRKEKGIVILWYGKHVEEARKGASKSFRKEA